MTEADIAARMLELSEAPFPNENDWNKVWLIQARQVVLLEQILAELKTHSSDRLKPGPQP